MGSSLLWQKVIIGLKGLNVILILCVDLVPVQRGHYEISLKLYWKQIVSKVWFWDNDGMGQDMRLKCGGHLNAVEPNLKVLGFSQPPNT